MQIVIEIDENVFTRLFDNGTEDYTIVNDDLFKIAKSIRKGTPLPKGHGKLGDLDKLKQKIEMGDDNIMEEDWYKLYDNIISEIDNAHAIIEAHNQIFNKYKVDEDRDDI